MDFISGADDAGLKQHVMNDHERSIASSAVTHDRQPGRKLPAGVTSSVIEALRDGDHAAYDSVFLKFYSRTMGFVSSLVKVREDVEDIVEDIFVSLWTNRGKLDPRKNFNSYLYAVAKNAVFNYFRYRKVRGNYLENLSYDELGHSVDEEFLANETKLLIGLVVDNMPAQRGRIFSMNYNEGLTNDEISQQLNISKKAVEKQLRLALADIRRVLATFLAMLTV